MKAAQPEAQSYETRAESPETPLIPRRLRMSYERAIMREIPQPRGLVISWQPAESVFLMLLPKRGGTWTHGRTSVVIPAHEAVGLELFIEEKTAPIVAALAKTGGAS